MVCIYIILDNYIFFVPRSYRWGRVSRSKVLVQCFGGWTNFQRGCEEENDMFGVCPWWQLTTEKEPQILLSGWGATQYQQQKILLFCSICRGQTELSCWKNQQRWTSLGEHNAGKAERILSRKCSARNHLQKYTKRIKMSRFNTNKKISWSARWGNVLLQRRDHIESSRRFSIEVSQIPTL